MLSCSEFQEIMIEGDDFSHAQGCLSCAEDLKKCQFVAAQFKALPMVEPSPEILKAIFNLARKNQKHFFVRFAQQWKAFWKQSWIPLPVGVMAMMVIAAAFLFPLTSPDRSQQAQVESHSGPLTNEGLGPLGLASPYQNVAAPLTFNADPLAPNDQEALWQEKQRAVMEAQADALMMRGRRLKTLGRVDLALDDFETITRFYPDYTYLGDVLMYRAQCYAFQGNIDKALESLESYVQKYPDKRSVVQPMMTQLSSEKK